MLLLYRASKNIVPQNELDQWRTRICLTVYYTDDEDSTDARTMKRGPRLVLLQDPYGNTFPLVTTGQTADVINLDRALRGALWLGHEAKRSCVSLVGNCRQASCPLFGCTKALMNWPPRQSGIGVDTFPSACHLPGFEYKTVPGLSLIT